MPLQKILTPSILDGLRNHPDTSAKFMLGLITYFGFYTHQQKETGWELLIEAKESEAYLLYNSIADRYGLTSREAAWSFVLFTLSMGLFGLPETTRAKKALCACEDLCLPLARLLTSGISHSDATPSPTVL